MGTGDATKGSAWVLVMLCLNALVAALARLVVEIDPRIAFRAHRPVVEHFRLFRLTPGCTNTRGSARKRECPRVRLVVLEQDSIPEGGTTMGLTIDVWADVLCPWCYLGEQRLSNAIAQSAHADRIDLRVHTFQLDPDADTTIRPLVDYLAAKFGVSAEQARSIDDGAGQQARAEGLKYDSDRPAGSTFDMLRLVQLGVRHGVGWDYLRAMQAELFGGNFDAYEHDTLIRLGEGLGIPAGEIRDVLASDRYADEVRADHQAAIRLGARGVPFTVLGGVLGIPGAVSTGQYTAAIDQAWEKLHG